MKPLTIDQIEALTKNDRVSATLDGTDIVTRPMFPMTEREAGQLLDDCGLKGSHSWLEYFRKRGEITATEDAWGRAAVVEARKRIVDMGSVNLYVFACHALDITYYDFMVAYVAASERVREEFGDVVPVAEYFGRHELVAFEAFVKEFHPPHGTDEGLVRGRVVFRLTDATRAQFEAAKSAK